MKNKEFNLTTNCSKIPKEFNLSEKICEDEFKIEECSWIFVEDIKEFIRLLKEEIVERRRGDVGTYWTKTDLKELAETIDKLAGDKFA